MRGLKSERDQHPRSLSPAPEKSRQTKDNSMCLHHRRELSPPRTLMSKTRWRRATARDRATAEEARSTSKKS